MSDDYYCDFILNGKVQVQVVAETENVLAFHHVFRSWDTHIVIIPKKHVLSFVEIQDPGLFSEICQVLVQIIKEMRFAETNYKIITNGGSYQSNKHLHIHLVSGET